MFHLWEMKKTAEFHYVLRIVIQISIFVNKKNI